MFFLYFDEKLTLVKEVPDEIIEMRRIKTSVALVRRKP